MPMVVLSVRGKASEWGLTLPMKWDQITAMREDGIDVGILENTVPAWAVNIGLLKPWCLFQDLFNFKNPFRS